MTDHLEITFIGTGASIPSSRRRLPAIVIHHNGENILCDCGEGTQIRLHKTNLSPSKISTIVISHLHGDHIFGLGGFLSTQQMLGRTSPLALYGPAGIRKYVEMLQSISGFEIHYALDIVELKKKMSHFSAAGFDITAMPLDHRITCFGYRFQGPAKPGRFDAEKAKKLNIPSGPVRARLQMGESVIVDGRTIGPGEVLGPERPGRSIAYCTDTRPADNAVDLARHCSLLIHDSTFWDEHQAWAEQTFHSTSREAAVIAQKSACRKLLLWHISNRYDEEQENQLLMQAREIFPNTMLSHDLMQVPISRADSRTPGRAP